MAMTVDHVMHRYISLKSAGFFSCFTREKVEEQNFCLKSFSDWQINHPSSHSGRTKEHLLDKEMAERWQFYQCGLEL